MSREAKRLSNWTVVNLFSKRCHFLPRIPWHIFFHLLKCGVGNKNELGVTPAGSQTSNSSTHSWSSQTLVVSTWFFSSMSKICATVKIYNNAFLIFRMQVFFPCLEVKKLTDCMAECLALRGQDFTILKPLGHNRDILHWTSGTILHSLCLYQL